MKDSFAENDGREYLHLLHCYDANANVEFCSINALFFSQADGMSGCERISGFI